jgi:hypothetical protein
MLAENVWTRSNVASFKDALSGTIAAMPDDMQVRFTIVHTVNVFQPDDATSDDEEVEVPGKSPKKRRKTKSKEMAAANRDTNQDLAIATPVSRARHFVTALIASVSS